MRQHGPERCLLRQVPQMKAHAVGAPTSPSLLLASLNQGNLTLLTSLLDFIILPRAHSLLPKVEAGAAMAATRARVRLVLPGLGTGRLELDHLLLLGHPPVLKDPQGVPILAVCVPHESVEARQSNETARARLANHNHLMTIIVQKHLGLIKTMLQGLSQKVVPQSRDQFKGVPPQPGNEVHVHPERSVVLGPIGILENHGKVKSSLKQAFVSDRGERNTVDLQVLQSGDVTEKSAGNCVPPAVLRMPQVSPLESFPRSRNALTSQFVLLSFF